MTNAKPVGKTNLIRQQILSALLDTKPVSWVHKRIDPETNEVTSTKVTATAVANPLAQNVSAENVDRAARRWIR